MYNSETKRYFFDIMSDFKIFAITHVTQSESLLLDIKSRDALRIDEKKGTMILIRDQSFIRSGGDAMYEEVAIVDKAPKIFSLNIVEETGSIAWDNVKRLRFLMKNKDVIIVQFVSRFVAKRAADVLSKLVSSFSHLTFTYPDVTKTPASTSTEITVFGGTTDEDTYIFFEYPALLGCSRDRTTLTNLRKIRIGEDRRPAFFSGKHFNSLVNAYETAGFGRVKKELFDRWSGQYGKHFHEAYSKWRKLKYWQSYNHIPGSTEISHKDILARNMQTFRKCLKERKKMDALKTVATPLTYVLPDDMKDLECAMKKYEENGTLKSTQWISKPYARSRGEGIELWNGETLTKELIPRLKKMISKHQDESEEVKDDEAETKEEKTRFMHFVERRKARLEMKRVEDETALVVQTYISRPFLVDNLKFDCRVYCVATSFDPICLWLYEEGLGRFATTPYVFFNYSLSVVHKHTHTHIHTHTQNAYFQILREECCRRL